MLVVCANIWRALSSKWFPRRNRPVSQWCHFYWNTPRNMTCLELNVTVKEVYWMQEMLISTFTSQFFSCSCVMTIYVWSQTVSNQVHSIQWNYFEISIEYKHKNTWTILQPKEFYILLLKVSPLTLKRLITNFVFVK